MPSRNAPISTSRIQPHHLPLNTSEHYWIVLQGAALSPLAKELKGFEAYGEFWIAPIALCWSDVWQQTEATLLAHHAAADTEAAIIPAVLRPTLEEIGNQLRPFTDISRLAQSLWLGDALLADRLTCYLQPIVTRDGSIYGYEAFVRAVQPDQSLIGGYAIMAASRAMHIEYRLDRYLHHRAIQAFVEGGYSGKLFINFFSGFIHRPEVYLDGLGRAAQACALAPERIVLDLAQPETQKNLDHMKSIADYCRSQGYGVALDDIALPELTEGLLTSLKPHFIKIDHALTKDCARPDVASRVRNLTALAHRYLAQVIGEGVESETIGTALLESGVDLLQGYHIGEPMPAEIQTKISMSY